MDENNEPSTVDKAELDMLRALAWKAAAYHRSLVEQGVSAELADQLVRDWHHTKVELRTPISLGRHFVS